MDWLGQGEAYQEAFEDAQEHAVETLEEEARRHGRCLSRTTCVLQGERCGTVRKYSDVLLIFLLKAARPEVYSERRHVTGDVNVNVTEQALLEARLRAPKWKSRTSS